MSDSDEDDKPTVVLDLNALRKQQMKDDEELANIAGELEFNVDAAKAAAAAPSARPPVARPPGKQAIAPRIRPKFPIILFDFQNDFFKSSRAQFPKGFEYQLCSTLPELNNHLKVKTFQIVVFNYDQNPKAINQLSAQIKLKFPTTKVLIMAKAISPDKAKIHAQTPSGASGYFQLPLDAEKIEKEFDKIQLESEKAG